MNKYLFPSLLCLFGFVSQVAGDDLTPLSDEFEDAASLSEWSRIYQTEGWGADQMESVDIGQSREGHLTVVPRTSSWYRDFRGILMYKLVEGDFVVTMSVEPRNRAGDAAPAASYSLAGIMARAPRESVTEPAEWTRGGENYVFLSLGTANDPGSYQFEVKTTRQSVSSLGIDEGAASALIQVARVGDVFLVLRQLEGGEWEVHRRYERPDMPDTLQVGITAYTDWESISNMDAFDHNRTVVEGGSPDLSAAVDYFRFRRPRIPSWLEGADFMDSTEVSDERVVELFANRSNRDPSAPPEFDLEILSRRHLPGEGIQLEVASVPGYFYRVESSGNLENWVTVDEREAVSDSVLFTVPERSAAAMYLRVVEE
ncbi:hypothetical protein [Pelagicoccus mobilis]|uniref:Uncharacterized protein n=1 Tax=Pelagicoccus mobilis TaxID=415221 RepID=A0A934VP44_9BACT|nr:hypothetical protein [Pelagicoccus mobilis]MBK1875435.1 hypothetical protein [Pelagicoccus mobilis]